MNVKRRIGFLFGMRASASLAVFLTSSCASPPAANPQAEDREAKARIEQRLEEIFSAAMNKDFDRLDSYHLYGPKFTKFTGLSAQRLDAAASRQSEHQGLSAIDGLSMEARDLKIDLFGDVAVATLIVEAGYVYEGRPVRVQERATLVLVEEEGAWRIAHEHFSPAQ